MPITDIQRRQATTYRLRFGTKVPVMKNGKPERNADGTPKTRPAKLTDAIRVTADNPDVVDAFVEVYGGERREWQPDERRHEWEAYLPTNTMSIYLLPGMSLSQWWEKWRGGVCERRCDGQIDTKSGKKCETLCPSRDPSVRTASAKECNPVTRVHVICPDVPVVGAGMFVINGLIGAETLPESIRNANIALSSGLFVPARLTIVEHRGATHFIVPRIDLPGISMNNMIEAATAKREGNAIDLASRHVLGGVHPAFKPAGALAGPSLREQAEEVNHPPADTPRANAAEPIPSTGAVPRTVAEAEDDGIEDAELVYDETDGEPSDHPRDDGQAGPDPQDGGSGSAGATQRLAIACREAGLDDDGRHDIAELASDGRTRSTKDLTDEERGVAHDAVHRIREGTARLDRDDAGGVILRDARYGWKTSTERAEGGAPAAQNPASESAGATPYTYEQIQGMNGRELADALIALKLSPAGKTEELRDRLMEFCGVGNEPF